MPTNKPKPVREAPIQFRPGNALGKFIDAEAKAFGLTPSEFARRGCVAFYSGWRDVDYLTLTEMSQTRAGEGPDDPFTNAACRAALWREQKEKQDGSKMNAHERTAWLKGILADLREQHAERAESMSTRLPQANLVAAE